MIDKTQGVAIPALPSFGLPVSPMPGGVADPVIDAEVWERYFGDVGDVPPLPGDIEQILNAPCPFWAGRKVRDTHLLALIPAQVTGSPLSSALHLPTPPPMLRSSPLRVLKAQQGFTTPCILPNKFLYSYQMQLAC